jgi:hypothetical protein
MTNATLPTEIADEISSLPVVHQDTIVSTIMIAKYSEASVLLAVHTCKLRLSCRRKLCSTARMNT